MGNILSLAQGKLMEQVGNSGGYIESPAKLRNTHCLLRLYPTDI
jgi:hypothetical protein